MLGFASSITYHPNGLYNQIVHSNGVIDTQTNDPSGMRRPRRLSSALGGTTLWSSDDYQYDGAGNVKKIGNNTYLYDEVCRVVSATVHDGPTGGGAASVDPTWGAGQVDARHEHVGEITRVASAATRG